MGPVSPKTLLLDTNVWLSYYLGSREDSDLAKQLLNLAVENDAQLAYAVTTAKDLFFLLAADCKRAYKTEHGQLTEAAAAAANELAWGCVRHLSELAIAVPCDHTDVWMAQKQRRLHGDFGDGLVVAAAMRVKADLLVTADKALLLHAPVAAVDVADAIKYLEDLA